MNVYVASKAKHAAMWRGLRAAGLNITSTWIDEAGEGESDSSASLWRRCIDEARRADAVIAYFEDGEEWKGAFVEIGAALAHDAYVYVVGDPPGSWRNHPLVVNVDSIAEAIGRVVKR